MNVFSHTDYREYLAEKLGSGQRNGLRQRLAETLECQPAHLSQVLNGKNHLSVEHAFGVNRFFAHTENESEYFLNIVQASRAGTKEAAEYFKHKAFKLKEKSLKIKDKLSVDKRELNSEEQSIYYGDNLYALAHVASSLPQIKTAQDLAKVLEVETETIVAILEFLLRTGLVEKHRDELRVGPGHTYLGADSPHIKKHHLNLRLEAVRRIEKGILKNNVHYGTYASISKADAFKIKEKILDLIDQNLKIIGPSKEEAMYCYAIDFFQLA